MLRWSQLFSVVTWPNLTNCHCVTILLGSKLEPVMSVVMGGATTETDACSILHDVLPVEYKPGDASACVSYLLIYQ